MHPDTDPTIPFADAIIELVEDVSVEDPEAVARWVAEWFAEVLEEQEERWPGEPPAASL